jgi:hypothetical protein
MRPKIAKSFTLGVKCNEQLKLRVLKFTCLSFCIIEHDHQTISKQLDLKGKNSCPTANNPKVAAPAAAFGLASETSIGTLKKKPSSEESNNWMDVFRPFPEEFIQHVYRDKLGRVKL